MTCPECNSTNILEGKIRSYYGVVFTEKGTENKLRPHAYNVACKACKDCGKIFDFRIVTTGRNKVGKE